MPPPPPPPPTHTHTHFVDKTMSLLAQNQWLRENTIDAHGNLLFCRDCLVHCLGVHSTRIRRQRVIKQRMREEPIVEMTKSEVERKRLVDCVLQDDDELQTFAVWWKSKDEDDVVEVQYPHHRHGLAGKPSNHAKQDVLSQFLEFVDANSQLNGRQASSYSAQFFFLPKFTRVDAPREGEKNYDEKCKSSIVYEFNRVQREEGRQTCSSTVAR